MRRILGIIRRKKVKPREVYPFDGRTPTEIILEFFTNLGEKDALFTLLRKDERGEEYKVQTAKQEWRAYYTVKNDIRGGVQHRTAHNCKVIAGRVFWHVLKPCEGCPAGRVEDRKICRAGELVRTPPETPHYMISIGDPSITVEWLDGGAWEETDFPEYKKLVERPLSDAE